MRRAGEAFRANEDLFYDYRATAHGRTIEQVLRRHGALPAPFFLMAHGWTLATGRCGRVLQALRHRCERGRALLAGGGAALPGPLAAELDIGPVDRSLTLILMVFGTNLFYYTVGEPGMSHVYSLAWVALFCLASHRWFLHRRGRSLVVAAFAVGMLCADTPCERPGAAGGAFPGG